MMGIEVKESAPSVEEDHEEERAERSRKKRRNKRDAAGEKREVGH